jgi:hypothetical protein
MKFPILCVLILCLSLCCSPLALAQDSQKETAAIAAAKEWLAFVDSGHYGQSWKQAADYLKSSVTKEKFRDSLKAVRIPLGGVRSRKIQSAVPMTSLPGAPDGDYVVIQFETAFENKASAVETVTPMLEKNGRWRVSGYYIR